MKKVLVILAVLSVSWLGFVGCNKNANFYEGTFMKGNTADCQNVVTITKSIRDGLPVNTSLYVIFTDSTQATRLKDREKITFKIIKYHRDTVGHFANCLWADYDADIELEN